MRRLTPGQREYSVIVTRKRTERGLVSKGKAHLVRFARSCHAGQDASVRKAWQRSAALYARVSTRLEAPEEFGLMSATSRTDLLRLIADLRHHTLVARRSVFIDFSRTRKMWPDGTLLFAAELDRIHRATAAGLVRCNYPIDGVVEQVLQHLGLLGIMGRRARASISADNVREWRMYTDTSVDGRLTEPFVLEYRKLFSDQKSKKMYDGLVEAMTNCKHHAYDGRRYDRTDIPTEERWWMFTEVRDNKLSVAFCDLGIGITRSLRSGKKWPIQEVEKLLERFGGNTDARNIKAATVIGKTRTSKKHRGNGLQDLKDVIESVGAGYLLIFSNRGLYRYFADTKQEQCDDYKDSILGTLICWQIPIPEA